MTFFSKGSSMNASHKLISYLLIWDPRAVSNTFIKYGHAVLIGLSRAWFGILHRFYPSNAQLCKRLQKLVTSDRNLICNLSYQHRPEARRQDSWEYMQMSFLPICDGNGDGDGGGGNSTPGDEGSFWDFVFDPDLGACRPCASPASFPDQKWCQEAG